MPAGATSEGGGPEGVGPIEAPSGHKAFEEAEEADPTKPPRTHRLQGLPVERFSELQPGDWLWYYTASRSAGGGHSVIFARWTSEQKVAESGAIYREAICFSQTKPEKGGSEHRVRLGDRYSHSESIHPITHVSRVGAGARPATTVAEILAEPTGPRAAVLAARLSEQNRRFLAKRAAALARRERRQPVPEIDLAPLRDWLRAQNRGCIEELDEGLTPGQKNLLENANEREEIESLVRLNQRLRPLARNAEILARNMKQHYGEGLTKRRAEAQARLDELDQELANVDSQLEPVQAAITEQEQRQQAVDLAPAVQLLQRQLTVVGRQIQHLRRGPKREELQQQRRELRAELEALRGQQRERRSEQREIQTRIRALRRQTQTILRRRRQAEVRRATAERTLPYGRVHPGPLRGEETGRMTGRLLDLKPQPPWADLLVPAAG